MFVASSSHRHKTNISHYTTRRKLFASSGKEQSSMSVTTKETRLNPSGSGMRELYPAASDLRIYKRNTIRSQLSQVETQGITVKDRELEVIRVQTNFTSKRANQTSRHVVDGEGARQENDHRWGHVSRRTKGGATIFIII